MNDQKIIIERDCDVISVPNGERGFLKKGTTVQIMQAKGDSYTVYSDDGLFRISGINADAIGKEAHELPTIQEDISDEDFEAKVWEQMKTVYDPEIPVSVVDLGLIYSCVINKNDSGEYSVDIDMTLTAPGCGMGEILVQDIIDSINLLPRVSEVNVGLVFFPTWGVHMMSDAARLEVGLTR